MVCVQDGLRLRETTNIMRRDESPQSVEIEITQKHLALRLHELRRAAGQRLLRLWRGVLKDLFHWNLEMYAMRKATSTEDEY